MIVYHLPSEIPREGRFLALSKRIYVSREVFKIALPVFQGSLSRARVLDATPRRLGIDRAIYCCVLLPFPPSAGGKVTCIILGRMMCRQVGGGGGGRMSGKKWGEWEEVGRVGGGSWRVGEGRGMSGRKESAEWEERGREIRGDVSSSIGI